MLYKIAPFLMIIMVTWITSMAIVQLLKFRIKKKIVEAGLTDESLVKAILKDSLGYKERQQNILKWVFLAGFGGLGLIVQEFIPYNMNESLLPYGVILIFLSVGLLFYYLLNNYLSKNNQDA
eukprot:gene11664-13623_t